MMEVQRKRVISRNGVPFAHLCLVLQQRLVLLCRLQPAHPFPETKVVLGNCWLHFDKLPFLSLLTLPASTSQGISARISPSDV